MFLKLHYIANNDPVIINSDSIIAMDEIAEGETLQHETGTRIVTGKREWYVSETIETIGLKLEIETISTEEQETQRHVKELRNDCDKLREQIATANSLERAQLMIRYKEKLDALRAFIDHYE